MFGYIWRDLVRNPRRTVAALIGIALGVGLFSGVQFFSDGSRATLTKRALAPLALDVQALLRAPLGRSLQFTQRLEAPASLGQGAQAQVVLTVANHASVPANEVVVNDEPVLPLAYLPGSFTVDGAAVPDVDGRIPIAQGIGHTGLNLGTVPAGKTVVLTYRVSATSAIPATTELTLQGRISTRENVVPLAANAPAPVTQSQLRDRLRAIAGVTAADELSAVDLPAGSVQAGRATIADPVRLFAFDAAYQQHYPSIRIAAGSLRPDAAAVSAEAARALGVRPGGTVTVTLPGGTALTLPVSAVVDLSRARPLFYSRKSNKLEDFLYVPQVVVLPPSVFEQKVLPAYAAIASTEGTVARSLPTAEVDVLVARSRLNADPATAFAETSGIAKDVDAAAPGETLLIDNISNALQVATDDAAVGRRMFLFLGLPGILLAAFLTAYSGSILAATQRRENALLRLRGAHRGDLLRLLVGKAVLLAAAGSVVGTAVGFALVAVVLGPDALAQAPRRDVAISAATGLVVGLVATVLALSLPGIRSLRHEISQERREIPMNPIPAWRRWRLDLALLAVTAAAEGIAYLSGAFDAPAASVSQGLAVTLPSRLLLAPLVAWFGGTLAGVRVFQTATARLPAGNAAGFGPMLRGNLVRSLRRRYGALATGTVGVGLVVALAAALTVFSASYSDGKTSDSTFTVGSDLRVTPDPTSDRPHPPSAGQAFLVPGVTQVTPVVFKLENAVFVAPDNQDRADLAAVDPATFARTAAMRDSFFVGQTAAQALSALQQRPDALLVNDAVAARFSVEVGDQVKVLLARGTPQQKLESFVVAGRFTKFPGFPGGVDVVVNLARYSSATQLTDVDFYLLKAQDGSAASLARVEAAVRGGPGRSDPVTVESTSTALNKDQSSLTALDIHGLVDLDTFFTTMMSAAALALFVFGLLLQRRREYLTLRALGMPGRTLFGLVLAEGALVVSCGLLVGLPVGVGMGYLFVHILRPLFLLAPATIVPFGAVAGVASLPALAALVCAAMALATLRRLRVTEVLRDS